MLRHVQSAEGRMSAQAATERERRRAEDEERAAVLAAVQEVERAERQRKADAAARAQETQQVGMFLPGSGPLCDELLHTVAGGLLILYTLATGDPSKFEIQTSKSIECKLDAGTIPDCTFCSWQTSARSQDAQTDVMT